MYLDHFRLRDRPFKLTQDHSYYFGPPHQIPLNELCYSIEEEQGLALLLGDHGMGKTTILKRLLSSLPAQWKGILISDHSLGGQSILEVLASMLHLRLARNQSHLLAEHLKIQALRGRKVVLLVDEAQGLTNLQLEEVRFLTNLEHQARRLVEIVLAGPSLLSERLSHPELAGLRQRVVVQATVAPLTPSQTESYIAHRLRIAGRHETLFEPAAVAAIHEKTRGVPRLINVLCDRALIAAFARGSFDVDLSVVEAAEEDLKQFTEADRAAGPNGAAEGGDRANLSQVLSALARIEQTQERILRLLQSAERPVQVPIRADRRDDREG